MKVGLSRHLDVDQPLGVLPVEQDADRLADEPQVARPGRLVGAVAAASTLVDPLDDLGVDPDPGGEREAAVVQLDERDRPLRPLVERVAQADDGFVEVTRQAEHPRQHARASRRQHPDRQAVTGAVHDLVCGPVAAEHEHGSEALVRGEATQALAVASVQGVHRNDVDPLGELDEHGADRLRGDLARDGIPDQ
jgi:hypothetical protein